MRQLTIFILAIFLASCGGGGSDSGDNSAGKSSPPASIKKIQSDNNRAIKAGDKISYDVKYEYEEYGWAGEVLEKSSFQEKLNVEYFLSQRTVFGISQDTLSRQQYMGNSGVDTNYLLQSDQGEIIELGDLSEEIYAQKEASTLSLGIPLLAPSYAERVGTEAVYQYVAGTESTKPGVMDIKKTGTRTIKYNAIEVTATALGQFETYKITITDTWKDAGLLATFSGKNINTYYLHPSLGIIKFITTEEEYLQSTRLNKATLSGSIEATNIQY